MDASETLTTRGANVSIISNWIEDEGFIVKSPNDLELHQPESTSRLSVLGLRLFALTVSIVSVFQFVFLLNRTP